MEKYSDAARVEMKRLKEFSIKNDLSEIERLIDEALAFCADCSLPENALFDIRLAVEESVSNIIKYGYGDGEPHQIHLTVEAGNHGLILQIKDDGKAFNPLESPTPNISAPLEEKSIGGLGIYLLRSVMDRMEYKRDGNNNVLRLTKIYEGSD